MGGVNTPTGTVCNIVLKGHDENDGENADENVKLPENDENDDDQTCQGQTTTTSNGPSKGSQVTLGQSNGSPLIPLVYTKGGGMGGRMNIPG